MSRLNRSPRALALGSALAEIRLKSGLNQRAAAERFGVSQGVIARIEVGKRVPTPDETATLLGIYGASTEERTHLLHQARSVDNETWTEVSHRGTPIQLNTLSRYEREAVGLFEASPLLIPGLCQTPAYARAIMSAASDRIPAGEVEDRVLYRLGRQHVLSGANAPRFMALIDEPALIRRIGGRTVMADQLDHLVELSSQPNIEIRVIPIDVGYHPALTGGWFMMEFAAGPPIVHLEHVNFGSFLAAKRDTRSFLDARDSLLSVAMSQDESAKLIARHGRHHRQGDDLYDRA